MLNHEIDVPISDICFASDSLKMIGNLVNELVKNLWEYFQKREPSPQERNEPINAEYQSGTCYSMNPTDFETQKPSETIIVNSPTTSSLKTQKQLKK